MIEKSDENNPENYNVTVSELLGSEYYVHFDFSETEDIVCKSTAKEIINVGDVMSLKLDIDGVFIFDPITKKRIH